MYLGKKKCRILKGIRLKIAAANGISYAPHKCNHKGDCKGTCPACEEEIRYIENELSNRHSLGKAAVVVGTAIGIGALATGMSSCHTSGHIVGKTPAVERELEGDVAAPSSDSTRVKSVEVKKIKAAEVEESLKGVPVQRRNNSDN